MRLQFFFLGLDDANNFHPKVSVQELLYLLYPENAEPK